MLARGGGGSSLPWPKIPKVFDLNGKKVCMQMVKGPLNWGNYLPWKEEVRSKTKGKKKKPWNALWWPGGVMHVETRYSVGNQGRMT